MENVHANGTANLRRSQRLNGGKEKQEQVSARKGKGRGHSGRSKQTKAKRGKGRRIYQGKMEVRTTERGQ